MPYIKMEAFTWCKELWTPKTFNKISFLGNVLWIAVGIVLFGVFLDTEINESRFDFRCDVNNANVDKDFVRLECFVQYEKRNNKLSFPLYGFVIVNFCFPFLVCVLYSVIVTPRVKNLESRNTDVERRQDHQAKTTQRTLFIGYCCQLATRFCLKVVFSIFQQTEIFYPREFPSNFTCNFMRAVDQTANATENAQTPTYECSNQRAHKKSEWMYALVVVNGIFAFFLLIEIFIILSRARKGKRFMGDSQFYTDHLKSNYQLQEELQRKQNSQLELSLLTRSQQELQDSQEKGNEETVEQLQLERSTHLQTSIKCMKENVLKNTERLRDLLSPFRPNPGEGNKPKDLKLDQIYTNLIIHPERAYYHFPENRREQLKVYPKPEANLSPKRPGDIVDDNHKNILIVGRPGIGKSLFCTKFIRDWASDCLFDEAETSRPLLRFVIAFLVKFKRLNSTANLNLRELLNCSEFSTVNVTDEIWDYILENPNKVVIIFDGIDEFSARKGIQGDDSIYKDSVEVKMPLHALYTKIVSGKVLDGATVLTTTRPSAVSCIRDIKFSRVVEILGFSSGQVENYVQKFTGDDKDAGETIWQHIRNNLNLFSLCYIPVNCFIICSCLQYMLQNFCSSSTHTLASLPTKLTHIYSFAVKLFYFRHSDKYRTETVGQEEIFKTFDELDEETKERFKELGRIAFNGITEGRYTFESDEVRKMEDCGLLYRLPDLKVVARRPDKGPKAQYSFVHLTIQEFLAAKHITDNMEEAELREFVSEHITDDAWPVVLQFVAGLLSDRDKPLTDIFTDLLPVSTAYEEEEQELEPGIVTCWPSKKDKSLALKLLYCLYEIDAEDSVVRNKIRNIGFSALVFKSCQLGPVDCTAVVNFLKMHSEILMINLSLNEIGCLGCKEISEFLVFSTSVNDSNKLSSLNLSHNIVTNEGVKYLAEALKCTNCKLNSLNLAYNKLTDEGVKYLAEALKHRNCELSCLNLADIQLTDDGVKYLAEALMHGNCKISSLKFADKKLTDKGVKYLTEALTHDNCKLNSLDLWQTNMTDVGAKYLAEALKHSNCKLSSLNLWQIGNVTDEGVKYLTEALKHSNCKLSSLNLWQIGNVTDEGVKYLAEALKHSKCNLKSLDLWQSNVTDEGVKYLAEALKHSNCKLNSLDLWQTNVTDEGVKYLTEALKHSNCKLNSLNLRQNNITDMGVKNLAETLKYSNCKLNSLKLTYSKLTDEGVKYLAEALKHKNCKLNVLKLAHNKLTDEGVRYLADALKHSNCKLTSLNLWQSNVTNEGVEHLAEALKHSNCKLTSLKLR